MVIIIHVIVCNVFVLRVRGTWKVNCNREKKRA